MTAKCKERIQALLKWTMHEKQPTAASGGLGRKAEIVNAALEIGLGVVATGRRGDPYIWVEAVQLENGG